MQLRMSFIKLINSYVFNYMQGYIKATLKIFLGIEEMCVDVRFSGFHMSHRCPWVLNKDSDLFNM